MGARPVSLLALVAAGLVLLTGAFAASHRTKELDEEPPRARQPFTDESAAATGRCAINHARFGGPHAQMFKVTKDGVANYVVMEVTTKRDPLMRFVRNDWLRMAYGEEAPRIWLGSFGSSEAALTRAAELCPPSLRCFPGDEGCAVEARQATPAEIFSGR
jgi:hypothetical protein